MLHALCLSALLAGQSADVVTSLRLPAGQYREVNPFVPSQPLPFVALKAGLTTVTAVAAWKMRKQHPRLAVLVLVGGAATGCYAAGHNARLERR